MEMIIFYLFIFLFVISECCCIELLSGLATAVGIGAYASYNYLKCKQYECCTDDWIHFNKTKLDESFRRHVFGQHLAYLTISRSLSSFLHNKNPRKALVLSFNGLTGSGKNYVATIIANSTYQKGMASNFVHLYSGVKDFPHMKRVAAYQDRLHEEIHHHTSQCDRSLFIFDEVEKMAVGTLDALKPYIDYHENLNGVDYRKNIFIFLSNAGSSSIVGVTLKFWANGWDRSEITMKDIEPIINKGAFNEEGGFQYSELLRSELIDVFVPFLPLERRHVKQCIEEELKVRGEYITEDVLNKIADELIYFPENNLYSKSGCKRIVQKVDLHLN